MLSAAGDYDDDDGDGDDAPQSFPFLLWYE
jgi:hypothetical protein